MKSLIITIFLFVPAFLWGQGINFRDLDFQEALQQAWTEKKLVFVDCYTTWCGPCKYMMEKIFPQKEAGDYFNSRFVCVKFDMGREENKELGKKWKVNAYPCFLIFQSDGIMLHQFTGSSRQLGEFIAKIEAGLQPQKSMYYLQKRYEDGIITNRELLDYQFALKNSWRNEEAEKIHKELIGKLTDEEKLQKEFWSIFTEEDCTVGTYDFNLLLANIPVFEKNIGKEKLDKYLYDKFKRSLSYYIGDWEMEMPLEAVEEQIRALNISKKSNLLLLAELAQCVHGQKKNKQELFRVLENNIPSFYGEELEEALSAINTLKDIFQKQDYERAVVWLEKVIENPQNKNMEMILKRRVDYYKSISMGN